MEAKILQNKQSILRFLYKIQQYNCVHYYQSLTKESLCLFQKIPKSIFVDQNEVSTSIVFYHKDSKLVTFAFNSQYFNPPTIMVNTEHRFLLQPHPMYKLI